MVSMSVMDQIEPILQLRIHPEIPQNEELNGIFRGLEEFLSAYGPGYTFSLRYPKGKKHVFIQLKNYYSNCFEFGPLDLIGQKNYWWKVAVIQGMLTKLFLFAEYPTHYQRFELLSGESVHLSQKAIPLNPTLLDLLPNRTREVLTPLIKNPEKYTCTFEKGILTFQKQSKSSSVDLNAFSPLPIIDKGRIQSLRLTVEKRVPTSNQSWIITLDLIQSQIVTIRNYPKTLQWPEDHSIAERDVQVCNDVFSPLFNDPNHYQLTIAHEGAIGRATNQFQTNCKTDLQLKGSSTVDLDSVDTAIYCMRIQNVFFRIILLSDEVLVNTDRICVRGAYKVFPNAERLIVKKMANDVEYAAVRYFMGHPHPNLVSFDAIGEHAARPVESYIFQPRYQTDIAHAIQEEEEEFSASKLKTLFLQIAEGVRYLHTLSSQSMTFWPHAKHREIAHNDIKPMNIFLDQEGNCRIADFDAIDGLVGTPKYISPERFYISQLVFNKPQFGRAGDIWSLGITFLDMILASHGYKEVSLSQMKFLSPAEMSDQTNQIRAAFESQLQIMPFIDFSIELLQKDPKERIDIHEVIRRLKAFQIS